MKIISSLKREMQVLIKIWIKKAENQQTTVL